MDDFKIIYKILSYLQKIMDSEEPSYKPITAEWLKISEARWSRLIKMLCDNEYIEGVIIVDIDNAPYPHIVLKKVAITLKGLEYLHENATMKKVAQWLKGVIEIVK